MTMIENLSDATRRGLCFAMAVAIVAFGLTLGSIGADAAFQSAYTYATGAQVYVVQLASL